MSATTTQLPLYMWSKLIRMKIGVGICYHLCVCLQQKVCEALPNIIYKNKNKTTIQWYRNGFVHILSTRHYIVWCPSDGKKSIVFLFVFFPPCFCCPNDSAYQYFTHTHTFESQQFLLLITYLRSASDSHNNLKLFTITLQSVWDHMTRAITLRVLYE